jgi:nucleotide-binding universal stress UspA family protein
MLNLKNILVPIDLSENSIHSFNLGCTLSNQSGGLLHLMHVIKPNYNSDSLVDEDHLQKIKVNNVREELYKFIHEIPHPEANITEVIKFGEPLKEILSYSEKNNIDLIVINSHGWSGRLNSMMGNVANNIFKFSSVPVICFKNYTESAMKDFTRLHSTAENWVG